MALSSINPNSINSPIDKEVAITRKTIALIVFLLVIRFVVGYSLSRYPNSLWIGPVYQMLTYSISAYIVWIERDHLSIFNIDKLSLIIFILFRTVLLFYYSVLPLYQILAPVIFWCVAILLFYNLLKSSHFKLPNLSARHWIWFVIGIAVGLAFGAFQIYKTGETYTDFINIRKHIWLFLFFILYGLSNASIDEEPLFRGFIWGVLRERAWKEWHIIIFQAFLFSVIHFNKWDNIYKLTSAFFIYLLFGFLVSRSRSIATSMAGHAGYNSYGYFQALLSRT